MSSELGHFMQDLAQAMDVHFEMMDEVYSLDMPTAQNRMQTVHAVVQPSSIGDDMILFYTPVGPVSDEIDWRSLLELNIGTIYARVGIIADHIVIVAGQMLDSADLSEVIAILSEVSTLGDILEKRFFGETDRF